MNQNEHIQKVSGKYTFLLDDYWFMLQLIPLGMIYEPTMYLIIYSTTGRMNYVIDGITPLQKTKLIYKEIMNSVEDRMSFTIDFPDLYLATLDFNIKLD